MLPPPQLVQSTAALTRTGSRFAAARVARWLTTRHTLRVEAAIVLAFYAAYEASRGLVVGDRNVAVDHARAITSLEQRLHVFVEPSVQHAVEAVPELVTLIGGAYLTLHLSVTIGLLLWLHRRRPAAFAPVRTTLLLASALALVGFLLYPTAPPRLAGVGLVDTVSSRHVDLNNGLLSSLYNPYAAVPSLHMGYALVVTVTLVRYARTRLARLTGLLYSLFVLLVILATGNHFLFDAAAGAAVVALAHLLAYAIGRFAAAGRARRAGEALPTVARIPQRPSLERRLAA
jgi:PAP2 superfamily